MPFIRQYQEIIERDTSTIGSTFKVLHVTIFIITAISGMCTAFSFGRILESFNYNCILNADIVFSTNSFIESNVTITTTTIKPTTTIEPMNKTIAFLSSNLSEINNTSEPSNNNKTDDAFDFKYNAIDISHTHWNSNNLCNYCQFSYLVSMIFAVIWGAFFMILSKGGAGNPSDILPHPWRIVYPCLFSCSICSIIMLIITTQVLTGLHGFCKEFEPELHNTKCVAEIEIYTKQFGKDGSGFMRHYQMVVIFAYLSLFSWIAQLLLLFSRIITFIDFKLYIISITERNNEERVEQVVEYHDEPSTSKNKQLEKLDEEEQKIQIENNVSDQNQGNEKKAHFDNNLDEETEERFLQLMEKINMYKSMVGKNS